MSFIKFAVFIPLFFISLACCRTSCIKMFPDPAGSAIKIITDKTADIIEMTIAFNCNEGKWPLSAKDISKFNAGKNRFDFSSIKSIKFNAHNEQRISVDFDFNEFEHNSAKVTEYRGFFSVVIQDRKKCSENYVEIYVSNFTAGNLPPGNKNPFILKSPIIIKYDDFGKKTVAAVDKGFET